MSSAQTKISAEGLLAVQPALFDSRRFATAFLERVRLELQRISLAEIETAVEALVTTWHDGGTVFVAGNGGNATTSAHFVSDLSEAVWRQKRENRSWPFAVGLADNLPRLTALANDISYDEVFAHQIEGRIDVGDLLVLFSGSGDSANLLRAARVARGAGATVLGVLGSGGGEAAKLSEHTIILQSSEPGVVESAQVALHHLLTTTLRQRISGE